MTAREAAIDLIKVYVLRGDSYQHLKESWMGRWCDRYRAGIGNGGHTSECPAKSPDSIVVRWIEGRQCCAQFSLRELYDEIKNGNSQPSLF